MFAAADRRRALLTAALGFLRLPPKTPALRALHAWLDSWVGIGHVVVRMERIGFRVSGSGVAQFNWRARSPRPLSSPRSGMAVPPRGAALT